jgi:uncharacterized protein YlzI (FlbEa/FlbD family)
MWEYKTGGEMFLPYTDLNGKMVLIAVDEISEIYEDGFTTIRKRNGAMLYSDESVTELMNRLNGGV